MKKFIIPITIGAVVFWAVFFSIVYFTPPKIGEAIVITNVSYALLSALAGLTFTITLAIYFISGVFVTRLPGQDMLIASKRRLVRSLRRAFLFSFLIIAIEFLKVFSFLNFLNTALIIGIVILIELYFSNR
ncbi:MAG: hypothetical protein A2172_01025 [Candidatus Woykebacteria bacterium RBG_13_40_15]|uniref:Uncharacterized protein n=1 Tax=Candidatus Woykebacteria bacterium RBG_13_40_15 TaxID=1802593 RepID=A0A1G1W988_9BACT|nr:MAG: hypothetical protein A2172_01025 [Candidatus Woykebacteria bacterium RBG_13_40_15]